MTGHPNELLSAYVDGECDEEQKVEIEIHLSTCESCRKLVERFRAISACNIEPETVDEVTSKRFIVELRKRLVGTAKPARASHFASHGLEFLIAAAAVCIIVVSMFVALGGPLKNMFENAVGTETMGQNQAALSAGIY